MKSGIQSIYKLNRGQTKYGPAPHKPVLLLALIELFEKGRITANNIEITEELITGFHVWWNLLVTTPHKPSFYLPFFHMGSEDFWELEPNPGMVIPLTKRNSIKSFRALNRSVAYACLSDDLFNALLLKEKRAQIRENLLRKYFPVYQIEEVDVRDNYSIDIQEEILWEPGFNYVKSLKDSLNGLSNNKLKEKEVLVRSYVFSKAIRVLYENRCAVSGLQIQFDGKVNMIDACHIIPFAESKDDTIQNGIALSPTLHRAFDRGLISVSDEYTVLVSKKVRDQSQGSGIIQYKGSHIFLPKDSRFNPDLSRIADHRKRFGF